MSDPTEMEEAGNESPGMTGFAGESFDPAAETDSAIVTDERRPVNRSTIVTFVILVLGIGGVWFMHQRAGGPKSAMAASKETAQAKQTINDFLKGGESSMRLMETMLRNTQKVVQQFLNYPSMTQIPLADLKTNPFRARPPTGSTENVSEVNEKRKREEERVAALKSVQNLQLQSIMYGDNRRACMINGAIYTETQQVESFTVEKITPASVVVKTGSFRFELRMQR